MLATTDLTSLIAACASLITALAVATGLVLTLRGQRRTEAQVANVHAEVADVHTEVQTANGITLAALADRAEGRRITVDIPHDQRTTSEQGYVDNLDQGGRNLGHTAPDDRTSDGGPPTTQSERNEEGPS